MRRQLSAATNALVQSDARTSERLEAALLEEREQAAEDRQKLISEITSLVNNASDKQDVRWNDRVTLARSGMATSQSIFQVANDKYDRSMDTWSQKENLLVEEVMKSREGLKSKMKKDWAVNQVFVPYVSAVTNYLRSGYQ